MRHQVTVRNPPLWAVGGLNVLTLEMWSDCSVRNWDYTDPPVNEVYRTADRREREGDMEAVQ